MHDSTSLIVSDSRAAQCAAGHNPCEVLVDFNVNQVELWDVTDKVQPLPLSAVTNPNNRYIHSGWPTLDQRHLFFHDELEEIQLGLPTQIYTLDLTNLLAPTVNVSYQGPTTTTDHNGYTRGTYYYVSHYRRGVVVFDASQPSQLVEVGHFDNYLTPAANSAGTDGAWGVYPFLPSGNLLVSDIENGLFVLRDHAQTLNDNVGRLGFGALALTMTEGAGNVEIRVQRVTGHAGEVSVQYATSGASATDGTDFTARNGTLSWGVRDVNDRVIVVPMIDDTTVENTETFTVTLSAPTGGATLDGSANLVVTLNDNDAPPPSGGGGGGGGGGSFDILLLLWLASLLLARNKVTT